MAPDAFTPLPTRAASLHSPWAPFRHKTCAVIWTATLVSNISGWMYSATAAWLMTSLDSHPVMVSLVQVATSVPMVLFALRAGALADIIDTRRFLVAVEVAITVVSAQAVLDDRLDVVAAVLLQHHRLDALQMQNVRQQ